MEIFKVSRKIQIVCNFENKTNGFRHRATLMYDGRELEESTSSYQNRTWENYTYQSAMFELIRKVEKNKSLSPEEIKKCNRAIKHRSFLK